MFKHIKENKEFYITIAITILAIVIRLIAFNGHLECLIANCVYVMGK